MKQSFDFLRRFCYFLKTMRKARTASDMPPSGGPSRTSETLSRKLPHDVNNISPAEKKVKPVEGDVTFNALEETYGGSYHGQLADRPPVNLEDITIRFPGIINTPDSPLFPFPFVPQRIFLRPPLPGITFPVYGLNNQRPL